MIIVDISMTAKGYHPSSEWRRFGNETHEFPTLEDAKEFLQERYGTCKRVPMYVDKTDGTALQVGYVFGFRAEGWGSSSHEKWIQQDWVGMRECERVPLWHFAPERA
jgi:hypothetical protein